MKKAKLSFEILVLLLTAVITIATSKDKGTAADTVVSYGGASNCAGATYTNQLIQVSGTQITDPTNSDFSFFGLPVSNLEMGASPIAGSIGGVSRSCIHSTQTVGQDEMDVYTCYDNGSGSASCQVSFTPQ